MDFDRGTAVGTYNDTLEETGWGILDIASGYGAETADVDIMYAAGYLEGYLTARSVTVTSQIGLFFAIFNTFAENGPFACGFQRS